MTESPTLGAASLIGYRDYLVILARGQMDPRLRAKLDASDIVQETLLKAHRAFGQFRGQTEQQLAAWLRAILSNTLANAIRSFWRHEGKAEFFSLDGALEQSSARLEAWLADGQLLPEEVASRNEQMLMLAGALAQLPDDQRCVLEAKHLHGLTVAEICEQTGRTKPAVVGLLYRAMKTLRALLDGRDCPADEGLVS
jgi:RNA polymerase sigma-70 factor, ECF subfamily